MLMQYLLMSILMSLLLKQLCRYTVKLALTDAGGATLMVVLLLIKERRAKLSKTSVHVGAKITFLKKKETDFSS